jgi:hypothetical protein
METKKTPEPLDTEFKARITLPGERTDKSPYPFPSRVTRSNFERPHATKPLCTSELPHSPAPESGLGE